MQTDKRMGQWIISVYPFLSVAAFLSAMIDRLVYELYELTEEEIAAVEGAGAVGA
jgi:hypothetical protein